MDEKEEKLISKQLERHKKLIDDAKEDLLYNQALIEKKNYLRAHEDKFRDFLRKRDEENDDKVLRTIQLNIKDSEKHVEQLTNQLNNKDIKSSYLN